MWDGARSDGPGSLFLCKLTLMKKALLLCLLTFCTAYCLHAQQTSLANPGTNLVCIGQSTSIVCPYGATDVYTWEVSQDRGNTWTTVNPGSVYSLSTYNYGSTLTITPVDLTLNGSLYRCTVVYQGTNYTPSPHR